MKKELHGGVVAGVLVVVGLAVVLLAWKVLMPPGPVTLGPLSKAEVKAIAASHEKSAADIRQQQMQAVQQSQSGAR